MKHVRYLLALLLLLTLLLVACGPKTPGAVTGDTVTVNYVGRFTDGTLFDTNVQSVAEAEGLDKTNFQPLQVTIGEGKVIPGFEDALIGMHVGDKKTVTLLPDQAYGEVNPQLIMSINMDSDVARIVTLERRVNVTRAQFDSLPGGDHEVGDVIQAGDISYTVLSKDDANVIVNVNVNVGDKVILPNTFWNSTVIKVTNDTYTVRQDPVNGAFIKTPFGLTQINITNDTVHTRLLLEPGGQLITQNGEVGTVLSVNETHAILDFNHPFAGKTLVFDIERVS